jgi:myosin-15
VRHFAGQVWYNVEGFLEKNKDTIRSDILDLCLNSKMPTICAMFARNRSQSDVNRSVGRLDRLTAIKPRTSTVSARFQDSLGQLLEKASSTVDPLFVRCYKANSDQKAAQFDVDLMRKQMRDTNILATIRVRQLGYPARHRFSSFLLR